MAKIMWIIKVIRVMKSSHENSVAYLALRIEAELVLF